MKFVKEVEYWPVARVLPYAANARSHPESQVLQLMDSLRQFGFVSPCLVDAGGVLVAGHGRLLAAARLGFTEVPVIRLEHLSPAQVRALRLADNRIALNSEWDEVRLAREAAALAPDFDLEGLGFSAEDVAFLAAQVASAPAAEEEDEAEPEPAEKPPEIPAVSRLGDAWVCGPHRVICGDSTSRASVALCLAGERPHLMVTDPPYGVEYDPSWRAEAGVNTAGSNKMGKVLNDDRADWTEAWQLFPGDVAYVYHASLFTCEVLGSLEAAGFSPSAMIIWAKDRFTLGRGHYHWQHEPAWYAVRSGASDHWVGPPGQSTVWHIKAREDAGHGHGTQKPVECMRRPIANSSNPGDGVYEPFLGSGTTLIACEVEGRRCFGIELNPVYVDVVVRRWQQLSGLAAVLEGDGRSFAEISEERLPQAAGS